MSKPDNTAGDRNERFSPELYRELGKNGWRLPQTEREVRAAEDWISKNPERNAGRLPDMPDEKSSPKQDRILDRYLRTDQPDRSADESKSMNDERSNREHDRE